MILESNDNNFTYVLDDLYIHLAIAKNLILHGIWGVTSFEFSSSSSSILYPFMISIFWLLGGTNELTPLWINITTSNILIISLFRLLLHQKLSPILIFFIEMVLLLIIPIDYLIFTGLEHVLFCVFLVLMMNSIEIMLENKDQSHRFIIFQIISIIFVSIRYESLFLLIGIFISLTFLRKRILSLNWFILCITPVIIYGVVSMANGWGFLPNSLTMKTNLLNFNVEELSDKNTYLLLLFFGVIILVGMLNFLNNHENTPKRNLSNSGIWTIIFIITLIFHLFFGRLSSYSKMYRYECYLIILGFYCLIINFKELYQAFYSYYLFIQSRLRKKAQKFDINLQIIPKLLFTIIFILSILPNYLRIVESNEIIISSSRNIYVHYYYPALFFKTYYNSSTGLLIHDIGYITYLGECRIYDYNFLGSQRIKNENTLTENLYINNIYIGLLWPAYYEIPSGWIPVAIYNIEEEIIITPSDIYFCASNLTEANILKQHLQDFEPVLPDTVGIEYLI